MFYRQHKTFRYQFCNLKHFLKAEISEDIFASSCEQNPVTCHVTQSETELLLELVVDIPSIGDQCSQLIVATLVPSTPICLFFNLTKLHCKQTVVTDFCIGFVNKIHIIGEDMITETWIAKIKEIGCWTEELITFCPFSPVSAWSKKLPNFVVKHVDLSWDFGHDVPCMGWHIDVNNEGGFDTRPSSLYWQIEPGVFLA